MDDIAKYLSRKPTQVLTKLKLLSTERCLISAAFGENEKDTFLTAILNIDAEQQIITIDCGPKEYLNKRLHDSAIIKFSTEYKGIKVLFEGRNIKKAGRPEQPAFTISIPTSICWIQRRQFYRIKSPLSKESYCAIAFKNEDTETDIINFKLYDLSANGLSILVDSFEQANHLVSSTELNNCTLILENEEQQTISLEVKHQTPLNPNNPEKTKRVGFLITNISPKIESTILRYMQNVEREIKQKQK
ncbi:MAG: flagellar brake protein [Methylococcales bacterium]|nr:flagellar brake protein [Methylococcales bacterium]